MRSRELLFSVLILPVLVLAYLLAQFPRSPPPLVIGHSLAALPESHPSWTVYPEDLYEGGNYVTLPLGKVRYWLLGPEDGTKIVLIHGLSVPSLMWKDVAPILAQSGFRVLVYDLYGRGYSEAPHTTYSSTLYTTQLALLMQQIQWSQVHLVGISMGAAIAAAFTQDFPNLVAEKVVLIASTGLLESGDLSRTVKLMSSPLVEFLTSSLPFRLYLQHLADSESRSSELLDVTPSANDSLREIVRIQSAHLPGFNRAVGSSVRAGPIRGQASAFEALELQGKNVLVIHGTADTTVPYIFASRIRNLIPSSKLVTIEHGPHDLPVSNARDVNAALISFLR